MKVSLGIIASENDSKYIGKCIRSAKKHCSEVVVVIQGKAPLLEKEVRSAEPKSFIMHTSQKGTADIDRNMLANIITGDYLLMMDADEVLSPALKKYLQKCDFSYDIYFIPFKNLVDGVNIENILGKDYHPRLFKRGSLVWPSEIHTHPDVKSSNCIFLDDKYHIIHHRTSEQIVTSHRLRSAIPKTQRNVELEKNFLTSLSRMLKKDLVSKVYDQNYNPSSI